MTVAQIRDRRLGMLRGRQPAAGALGHSDNVASWPVDASDEIALDNYLQQASYDVAFDELFEAKSVFYKSPSGKFRFLINTFRRGAGA